MKNDKSFHFENEENKHWHVNSEGLFYLKLIWLTFSEKHLHRSLEGMLMLPKIEKISPKYVDFWIF